jgi:hypothetical protein
MTIPTSNDAIIRDAMAGRNARKDRDALSFNVHLRKLDVKLNDNFLPVFSIPVFQQSSHVPSDNNYKRAMQGFEFHSHDYIYSLCDTCEDMRSPGSIYSTIHSSPRDYITKEYARVQEKHGSHYFKTLLLVAVLASDFPEKATVKSMNLF